MNCPKCGSETVLQIGKHGKDGIAPFVCECGCKWEERAATLMQRIKEAESLEDLAETFVYKKPLLFGRMWYSRLCIFGGFTSKKSAVEYTLQLLREG